MKKYLLITLLLISSEGFANENLLASARNFMHDYLSSASNYITTEEDANIMPVAKHYHDPAILISPGGKPSFSDNQKLAKGLAFFLSGLKAQGATKIQWHKLELVELDKHHALASGLVHISNARGEIIDRKAAVYSLYQSKEGWNIVLNHGHDIDNSLSFNQ